jgi:tetratricopeptide (TPR) repeat protein
MKLLAIALAITATTLAYAQPASQQDRAAERIAKAKQLFAANDFTGAARAFEEAYALDPDPAYLFNVAQAYRSAHLCADAARYYRKFLEAAPDAPNRETVAGLLRDQQACAAEQVAPTKLLPPREPLPPPPSHHSRKAIGLGLAAGGVAALAVGGLFVWDVYRLADLKSGLCGDFGKPGQPDCVWTDDKEAREHRYDDRARRAQIMAGSAFTVGALAIVGGVVLYMSGARVENPIAVAPVPGGAVAVVGLTF